MSAGVGILELAAFAAAGAALAVVYLWALAAAARRLVDGGVGAAAALTALRLALLVGALTAASLRGGGPLIATALGLLVARLALVGRIGGAG